ncbi:enkurin isoform X3 [Corvus kubaryi]|nr:enkurin isoform X3 [Corvus kubaryi]
MGPAKVAVPSPNDFLQKHSKEPKLAPKKKEEDGKKLLPLSVPQRTYRPVIRIKKNFIIKNAVAVIRGVPKKPRPFCVDTRQGDKYPLEPSGLVPKYIKKKNYGVTPKYVTQRNEEIKREEEEYEASVLEQLKKKAMKTLSDEERTNILKILDAATASKLNFPIPLNWKVDRSQIPACSATVSPALVQESRRTMCISSAAHHRMLLSPAKGAAFPMASVFMTVGEWFEMLFHVLPDVCNTVCQTCSATLKISSSHPMDWVTASGNTQELKILEYVKTGYENNSELLPTCPKVLYIR